MQLLCFAFNKVWLVFQLAFCLRRLPPLITMSMGDFQQNKYNTLTYMDFQYNLFHLKKCAHNDLDKTTIRKSSSIFLLNQM